MCRCLLTMVKLICLHNLHSIVTYAAAFHLWVGEARSSSVLYGYSSALERTDKILRNITHVATKMNMFRTRTHPNNHFGACLGSKHTEDASPTAHIQHHLILEQVLIVEHRVPVGKSSHLIFQHLLQVYQGSDKSGKRMDMV